MRLTKTCIYILVTLTLSFPTTSAATPLKHWTFRLDANAGMLGVRMSSDYPDETSMFPILFGELIAGYNTKYVSFEYGIGGPVFIQSLGVRVRLLPSGGPYLGGNYNLTFIDGFAHFIRADLGYEYVASGGFTFLVGVGVLGVLSDFASSDKVGFLTRTGLGYSF